MGKICGKQRLHTLRFLPGNRLNYYVGGEIVTVSHMDRWVTAKALCNLIHTFNLPLT